MEASASSSNLFYFKDNCHPRGKRSVQETKMWGKSKGIKNREVPLKGQL